MKPGWRTAALGAVSGVVVTVLAGGVWLADDLTPNPMSGAVGVQAVIVPVTTDTRVVSSSVTLKATLDAPLAGVAYRSGTLSTLTAHPGGAVRDGKVIGRIDSFPLVAMVSPQPLFRDLAVGAKGADVRMLKEWLSRRGQHPGTLSAPYTRQTRNAVRRWQKAVGLPITGRFERQQVVWVGASPGTVATIDTAPGSAVTSGQKLFTLQASARVVQVVEPTGGVAKGESTLQVGGAKVAYEPRSGTITRPADVKAVMAALGGKDEGVARVVATKEKTVAIVPASAVVTDEAGASCVFPDATAAPVPVMPQGGGLGGVDVEPDPALTQVLVNPAEIRADLTCG